jgi:hypothetical protein
MSGEDSREQVEKPNPDLKSLERLVGTWELSGEIQGRIRYEWMEGGFFLVQHVDLEYGRKIKGIEVIGHLKLSGEKPSKNIRSRFYDFLTGLTLDYTYEVVDENITIWFGEKGSKNLFKAQFSRDGKSYSGAWKWPGGGYTLTATKVSSDA